MKLRCSSLTTNGWREIIEATNIDNVCTTFFCFEKPKRLTNNTNNNKKILT